MTVRTSVMTLGKCSYKVEAERFVATIETDVARGQYIDPLLGKVSFGEFAREWLTTTGHLRPKTRVGYESLLRTHLLPHFGDQPIGKVRPVDVGRFFSSLSESGMSPSRMRQTKNVLKLIFDEAVRNGYLARTPVEGVRLPRPQKREMSVLSPDQVSLIASNVPERYEALIFLLAYGGLRWGEAAALRRGRFNELKNRVEVLEAVSEVNGALYFGPTKTGQVRSVAIPVFLRNLLAAHLTNFVNEVPDALVFTTQNDTTLRIGNFRRRVWWPALDESELPRSVRIHDLRHTCASMLIARGANAKAIQQHLGHSSITVTFDVYGHLMAFTSTPYWIIVIPTILSAALFVLFSLPVQARSLSTCRRRQLRRESLAVVFTGGIMEGAELVGLIHKNAGNHHVIRASWEL